MTTYAINHKQILLQNISYVTEPEPRMEFDEHFNLVPTTQYVFTIVFSKGCSIDYAAEKALVVSEYNNLMKWIHGSVA